MKIVYKFNTTMKKHELTILNTNHKNKQERQTLDCFNKHLGNAKVILTIDLAGSSQPIHIYQS